MRNRWWVGAVLAVAAVALAACGSSSPNAPPAATAAHHNSGSSSSGSASATIKTMSTSKGTVLVNAAGRTLYWFAKDTSTKSNCSGSCASYWPPVTGKAPAAGSLPHSFGTIKRANGETQLTYDGHPLYTYVGDSAAGQVKGNGVNLSGGLWWAMTPTGKLLGKSSSSSSSSGGSTSSGSSSSGSSSSGGW